MNNKQKFGCLIAVIRILLTTPLWYVLFYLVLQKIEATDVMWLLFWIYAPLGLLIGLLLEIGNVLFPTEEK